MASKSLPQKALTQRALSQRTLLKRVLPQRALQLINEYSKPLTRPDWRYGTFHAILFKNSYYLTHLEFALKYVLIYAEDSSKIIDNFGYNIYSFWNKDFTFNKYIQEYGENIFLIFDKNETEFNFYKAILSILKNTNHLELLFKCTPHQCVSYYEYTRD